MTLDAQQGEAEVQESSFYNLTTTKVGEMCFENEGLGASSGKTTACGPNSAQCSNLT